MFVSGVIPWFELPVPSKHTTVLLDMLAMEKRIKERIIREERDANHELTYQYG